MKRLLQNPLIILILLCIFPLWALTIHGLPLTHDGVIHVARIANFFQNLSEGILVPRWAANLNWGFGTPIPMFVYPLPSYIASLFHFLGYSLVDSTKLVFAFSYIASAVAMYLWTRDLWGKIPAISAAVLYTFAPYRFVDLYVRGALGEHVAFVFPPLICFALLRLSKDTKRSAWYMSALALSVAGIILSHNALSVMFLPIIVLYGVYLYVFENKNNRFAVQSIIGLLYGFLLSAFFWIPATYELKYTLIDKVITGSTTGRFTSWMSFIYSPWNYGGSDVLSKQLGPIAWIVIFGSVWFVTRVKKLHQRWFIIGSLVVLVFSLFVMTQQSSFIWDSSSLLEKFQFPWRFLSATTFVIAVLGGFLVSILPKKTFRYILLLLVVAVAYTIPQWRPKGYENKPDSYYTGVFSHTTDSGETSPIWSIRFMLDPAKTPIEVIDGQASVELLTRRSTNHSYSITATSRAQILENTLYFPGWEVFVDGNRVETEFQNPIHRGLMTFWVEPGDHVVDIRFGDTKVRTAATILSLVSWFGLGIWHIIKRRIN